MTTDAATVCTFWQGSTLRRIPACPDPVLSRDLANLARQATDPATLSGSLYESLRKNLTHDGAREILRALAALAHEGQPEGMRLLAALLDVAAPASRLLPRIRNMTSSRRLWRDRLHEDENPGALLEDWKRRRGDLIARCGRVMETRGWRQERDAGVPGWEEHWGSMRTVVAKLLRAAHLRGDLDPDDRSILAELLRLEIDALEERVSHLAGTVDPYRVSAITRLLPLLSGADADVRDLRGIVSDLENGDIRQALTVPRLRAMDVMDDREVMALVNLMTGEEETAWLAELLGAQRARPVPVHALAYGAARLMTLGGLMHKAGIRAQPQDLLSCLRLVLDYNGEDEVSIPVPSALLDGVATCLEKGQTLESGTRLPDSGPEGWPLGGVEILVGQLVVVLPTSAADFPAWPHFLPTEGDHDPLLALALSGSESDSRSNPDDGEEAGDEKAEEALNVSAMKNLVLTNIQSTSLVLGFLRNAKFTSIPGLVESVAVRTRNPRIIEVIATDRTLHTGFANRGVALACLRSPVNVPPKTLRRFIHVKFVSKVDLKRMAQDKAGVRKEVLREIKKYLETLA